MLGVVRSVATIRPGSKRALVKLTIGGVLYPPGAGDRSVIPAEVWDGLSVSFQDKCLVNGYVEVAVDGARRQSTLTPHVCKVCGQEFPSMQALGGHKAGHTKRKKAKRKKARV